MFLPLQSGTKSDSDPSFAPTTDRYRYLLLFAAGPLESTMLCATAPLSTSCLARAAMPPSRPSLTSSTNLSSKIIVVGWLVD